MEEDPQGVSYVLRYYPACGELEDVTQEYWNQQVLYDFVESFSEATILGRAPDSTPPGDLAFPSDVVDRPGSCRVWQGFFVLAGAELEYSIEVPDGMSSTLYFEVALPMEESDGATIEVVLVDQGVEQTLVSATVRPLQPWRPISVDMTSLGGKAVVVSFRVHPGPSGDSTADWVAWRKVRMLLFEAPP